METELNYKITDSLRLPCNPFCSLHKSKATNMTKMMILTGTPYSKLKYMNLWTWLAKYKNTNMAK